MKSRGIKTLAKKTGLRSMEMGLFVIALSSLHGGTCIIPGKKRNYNLSSEVREKRTGKTEWE